MSKILMILLLRIKWQPVYIKDIGQASDASAIQTNIARVSGKEQVYLPIFKRPGANTISSVNEVRKAIPSLKERMPDDVNLRCYFRPIFLCSECHFRFKSGSFRRINFSSYCVDFIFWVIGGLP